MKKHSRKRSRALLFLKNYILMFLIVSFVATCSLLLFLSKMDFSDSEIRAAAPATFWNVFLLTALVCVLESVLRFVSVELPMKRILDATEKLTSGDFSVRISKPRLASRDSKQLIDAFNNMAEELSGLETLRTDFISNVSHEIKTPLAVIQNYGTLLKKSGLPEDERLEYAQRISESSRCLSSLVTNILKLNKLENQKIFPMSEKFNLSEQICEGLLEFESIWESKSISLETDIEENVYISSDPELLMLVWSNLLSNAFKFTDYSGVVFVSLKKHGQNIIFSVRDTGCGMTRETGGHIFEKFYQGDTSRATSGNGLGLALVKRVIDILGAEISVESTVGVGSTFEVKINAGED